MTKGYWNYLLKGETEISFTYYNWIQKFILENRRFII